MTKPKPRKGTKPAKPLTVAQRRAILVKAKWKLVRTFESIYSPTGSDDGPWANWRDGTITDDDGNRPRNATDAEFRAFVKRHTPKAAPTVRTVVHKAPIPGGSIALTTDKPVKPVGVWIMVSDTKRVRIPAGPVAFAMEALSARIDKLTGIVEGAPEPVTATRQKYDNDGKPSGEPLSIEYPMTIRGAFEFAQDGDNAAQGVTMGNLRRLAGRIDGALTRIAELEAAGKPVRQNDPPVDVAALCRAHNLKLGPYGDVYRNTDDGKVPTAPGARYVKVTIESGDWDYNEIVNADGQWKSLNSGNHTTLAAALAKYCPVKDEPYGEPERRADAIAAGWKLAPGLVNTFTPDGSYVSGSKPWVCVRSGRVHNGELCSSHETDRATFRAHLAKYAVKDEPVSDVPAKGPIQWKFLEGAWRAPVMHKDGRLGWAMQYIGGETVAVVRPDGMPIENWGRGDYHAHPLAAKAPPSEPVKPDPDATPEQRRGECERRGLKCDGRWPGRFTRSGSADEYPCAWEHGGTVARKDNDYAKTRTLPEFCAALDAVGLVAKPATAEERAALCEKWDAGDVVERLSVSLTAAELEAELRACLPYTREWREKVLVDAKWVCGMGTNGIRYHPTAADLTGYPCVWVVTGTVRWSASIPAAILPDRAAWLAFIRDNTPAPMDAPMLTGDAPLDALRAENAALKAQLAAVRAALEATNA